MYDFQHFIKPPHFFKAIYSPTARVKKIKKLLNYEKRANYNGLYVLYNT